MYEIVGSIIGLLVAIGAAIGYRTRTDTRLIFVELIALFEDLAETFIDLVAVLKNIKLVKKDVLPGIEGGYTIEFGDNAAALKSLNDMPSNLKEILGHLERLSQEVTKLGAILPKK